MGASATGLLRGSAQEGLKEPLWKGFCLWSCCTWPSREAGVGPELPSSGGPGAAAWPGLFLRSCFWRLGSPNQSQGELVLATCWCPRGRLTEVLSEQVSVVTAGGLPVGITLAPTPRTSAFCCFLLFQFLPDILRTEPRDSLVRPPGGLMEQSSRGHAAHGKASVLKDSKCYQMDLILEVKKRKKQKNPNQKPNREYMMILFLL